MKWMLTATANHCQLLVMPPSVLPLLPPLPFLTLLLLLLRGGCHCLRVHVCGQAVCRELCM